MRQVIYLGHFVRLLTDSELVESVRVWKGWSERTDVTGVLLCSRENFIHVVEGKADMIDAVMRYAVSFNATDGVEVLLDRRVAVRDYPTWTFGTNRQSVSRLVVEGACSFYLPPETGPSMASRRRLLPEIFLQSFRDSVT